MEASAISSRPLWRLSWRRFRQRPLQSFLLIIGVAIGVAMMVSIDLANDSAKRAFRLSTDAVTGRATHRITTRAPKGLDEATYLRLRTELGYVLSAPVVEGYVISEQLGSLPLRLLGVDPFAEPPFRNYLASESAGLEGLGALLTTPGAIIVSEEVATANGLQLGETITLDIDGRRVPSTLTGTLKADEGGTQQAFNDILITDIASAQEMLAMNGRLSHVDLIILDGGSLAAIEAMLAPGETIEPAASQGNAIRQMTAAFELNLSALSLLALVVGMFLIYNTVTFSVIQRRPLFGILRCLGVTGDQLFRLILAETILFSLIGAVLGIGLGILLGRGTVRLITQTINDFYFTVNVNNVSLSPTVLAKGLLFGVGAAALAALVPAVEAARTTPQTALIRSALESRIRQIIPWLWLAWALLTAVGIGLLRFNGGLVLLFAGLFAVLIGAALLTPPLTALFMRGLTPVGARLAGVLGRLAPRDIIRSLSRTSVAIAALMTAVSVVVGVSIMIDSFRQTVVEWLDQTLQADVYISPPAITANRVFGRLPEDVVAEIKAWPGIEEVVTSTTGEVFVSDFNRSIQLVAVDGDVSRGNRPYAWIADDVANPWQALTAGNGIIISEALALKENIETPPPPLTLETADGPQTFPILAIFYDYSSDQGTIMIDDDLYQAYWQDTRIGSMGLFVEPGQSPESLTSELQEHFKGRQELTIQSNSSLRRGSLEIFDRTFAITSALRLLAVIVAFIGVLSTMMSLQLEKARELGVLRATGMTIRQLWSLTLIETGLMGGTAGFLAVPLGFALAWILIYVINVRSFGWTLQMQLQPIHFLMAFLVSVSAALLAGIYPSYRLGKMVIATAVREE